MTVSYGETITIQRRTTQDAMGDASWVDHHTVSNVVVWWQTAPKASHPSDPQDDRRSEDISPVEFSVPAGSDILDSDRIKRADGSYYRVREIPQQWQSPWSGWQPGIVILARAVRD